MLILALKSCISHLRLSNSVRLFDYGNIFNRLVGLAPQYSRLFILLQYVKFIAGVFIRIWLDFMQTLYYFISG